MRWNFKYNSDQKNFDTLQKVSQHHVGVLSAVKFKDFRPGNDIELACVCKLHCIPTRYFHNVLSDSDVYQFLVFEVISSLAMQ